MTKMPTPMPGKPGAHGINGHGKPAMRVMPSKGATPARPPAAVPSASMQQSAAPRQAVQRKTTRGVGLWKGLFGSPHEKTVRKILDMHEKTIAAVQQGVKSNDRASILAFEHIAAMAPTGKTWMEGSDFHRRVHPNIVVVDSAIRKPDGSQRRVTRLKVGMGMSQKVIEGPENLDISHVPR